MMEVEEILKEGLKRVYSVKVSPDEIESRFLHKLQHIGKTAKIQGFRPGKAPLTVIKQRFGESVRGEVLEELISEKTAETLKERNLRPAVQPDVEITKYEEGNSFEFKFETEILPEIKHKSFSEIRLKRFTAEINGVTVDKTIEAIARDIIGPEKAEEQRPAREGDTLIIDMDGSVDGESLPGMKGDSLRITLGSKAFVGDFEDQLVGARSGDKKEVTVNFPAGFHLEHMAGKTAVFKVEVKDLLEHKPVEINDSLAKRLEFESAEDLRRHISGILAKRYADVSRSVLKRHLMDKLADLYDFPVPESVLKAEFESIWKQVQKEKKEGRIDESEAKKTDNELRREYQKIAERRLRLGLLFADIAQKNDINVTQSDLNNAIMNEARRFPGREKAVIDYYVKNKDARDRLYAPALEDKVIDFILSQIDITEDKVTVEELERLAEEAEK